PEGLPGGHHRYDAEGVAYISGRTGTLHRLRDGGAQSESDRSRGGTSSRRNPAGQWVVPSLYPTGTALAIKGGSVMAVEHHHLQLMDEYQDFAAAEVGTDTTDGSWRITDDAGADWALRKIAQAQRRIEQRKAFVEAEIARLQRWQEEANKQDLSDIEFFTSHLQSYFETLRESGALGKRKSYPLPHGVLAVRATQPKFERDNDQLLAWAKGTGDASLVRVKEEPAWSVSKQRITIAPDG